MNVLLTCDDGYDSVGFAELRRVARELGFKATCFAPAEDMSGIGSCRTLKSVFIDRLRDGFRVTGTPVDCVSLALSPRVRKIFKLPRFDLVLSGINYGANVGAETLACSGTYAAAHYAAHCGVPAIAISQDVRGKTCVFRTGLAVKAVQECLGLNLLGPRRSACVNVNLPAKPVSPSWKKCSRYCWFENTGGYDGDWRRDRLHPERFVWRQWWTPGKSVCHDAGASSLEAGYVTITSQYLRPKRRSTSALCSSKKRLDSRGSGR